MIVIAPIGQQFGQVYAPGGQQMLTQAQRTALIVRAQELKKQAAEEKRARAERIEQQYAIDVQREPTTPFEAEARRRVTEYKAEAAVQTSRRSFEKELSRYDPATRRKVTDLMKFYDSYEALPGYAAFQAGQRSMAQIMPSLLELHKRLLAQSQAQIDAKETEREARDARIWEEIQAEKTQKAEQEAQMRIHVSLRAREKREAAKVKAAEKKAAEDAKAAQQQAVRDRMRAESKAKWEEKLAAHPKQPGSPPVIKALVEISDQRGITPGELDPAAYKSLRSAVYARARQLSREFFYYERNVAGLRYYPTDRVTVSKTLAAEGYTMAAVTTPTVVRPTVTTARPTPITSTRTANDPMIQQAIQEAMSEARLESGQEVTDIAAFERLVMQKAAALTETTRKRARVADVQNAIRARMRFILEGIAV